MREKTVAEIWHLVLSFRDENTQSLFFLLMSEVYEVLKQYEFNDDFVHATIARVWVPNEKLGEYLESKSDVQ